MKTLNELPLNDLDRQIISEAVQILRDKFPIRKIVLFGSKARGDDKSDSDIDLLVLTDNSAPPDTKKQINQALYHFCSTPEYHYTDVQTIVVTEKEWYHGLYQAMPIRTEINRDGIEL